MVVVVVYQGKRFDGASFVNDLTDNSLSIKEIFDSQRVGGYYYYYYYYYYYFYFLFYASIFTSTYHSNIL